MYLIPLNVYRSPRVESRDHEYSESITMYRGEDSGPEFSEEEPEYTDIKVEVRPYTLN